VHRSWQLQEAKNKFSEVVEEALRGGPQIITRRGVETVVVISSAEYRKMLLSKKKLSQFFRQSPLGKFDIDMSRDTGDARRDADL